MLVTNRTDREIRQSSQCNRRKGHAGNSDEWRLAWVGAVRSKIRLADLLEVEWVAPPPESVPQWLEHTHSESVFVTKPHSSLQQRVRKNAPLSGHHPSAFCHQVRLASTMRMRER